MIQKFTFRHFTYFVFIYIYYIVAIGSSSTNLVAA